MKHSFTVGKPYYLEFNDHSFGMSEAVKCRALGWCVEVKKDGIHFTCWDVNDKDSDVKNQNIESFFICHANITKKKVLRSVPNRYDID